MEVELISKDIIFMVHNWYCNSSDKYPNNSFRIFKTYEEAYEVFSSLTDVNIESCSYASVYKMTNINAIDFVTNAIDYDINDQNIINIKNYNAKYDVMEYDIFEDGQGWKRPEGFHLKVFNINDEIHFPKYIVNRSTNH